MKRKFILPFLVTIVVTGCSNNNSNTVFDDSNAVYLSEMSTAKYVTLCDYSEIPIDIDEDDYGLDITEGDVTNEIESVLEEYYIYEDADHNGVQDGDVVTFNYYVEIQDEYSYSEDNCSFLVGSEDYSDEFYIFQSELIGAEIGETVEFEIELDETYNESLQGKLAAYEVTIVNIQSVTVQEFNDGWVKSLEIEDCNTTEDYYNYIYNQLYGEAYANFMADVESLVLEYMYENCSVSGDFPEGIVSRIYEDIVSTYETFALYYQMDYETLIMSTYEVNEDELENVLMEQVNEYISQSLILQAIANAEDLNPSNDDVEEYAQTYMDSYGYDNMEEMLEAEDIDYELLEENVMRENVVEFLSSRAVW